jgi:hypothetical protein
MPVAEKSAPVSRTLRITQDAFVDLQSLFPAPIRFGG